MQAFVRGSGCGLLLALLAVGTVGCSGQSAEPEHGSLSVPLRAYGASGAEYQLRDAEFEIHRYDYYGYGGSGMGEGESVIVVSSEDDPDASSISVELESGDYYLVLRPGWRMEQVGLDGATTVLATLLSEETQWVWVAPRATSWAEYHFGIGSRELWLNGKLNIDVRVSEDPNEGYGGMGGSGGYGGSAGSFGYAGSGGYGGYGG